MPTCCFMINVKTNNVSFISVKLQTDDPRIISKEHFGAFTVCWQFIFRVLSNLRASVEGDC